MHFPRDLVPDPTAATVRMGENGAPAGNPSDWLGDALGQITGQIQRRLHEVESRHAETLRDMQAKLERMSREAERARPNLPPDLAAAFGRIEEGMTELASRMTQPKPADGHADRFVFAPKTDDTISFVLDPPAPAHIATPRPRGPAPEGGWDNEAAEALMQLYESGDTGLSADAMTLAAPVEDGFYKAPVMRSERPRATTVIAGLGEDRKWLEDRFGALTDQFSQSIANVRPDAVLDRMMTRIDSLESRFDTAIANVAKGVDKSASAASIKQIESQIAELGRQMGAVTQQLGRLGAIEQNLSELSAFAAAAQDMPAQSLVDQQSQFDVSALADAVASKAADRFSNLQPQAPALSPEIAKTQAAAHALLQEFMKERRRSDEQTNGVLDTMQEALVRLLDRVEAIDAATTGSRAPTDAPHHYVPEPVEPAAVPQPSPAQPQRQARPARAMSGHAAVQSPGQAERQRAREAELIAAQEAELAAAAAATVARGSKVEVIDADSLAAPEVEHEAPQHASSNNPRGRVRASVNANIPEPEVEAGAAVAPQGKKRNAPRAKSTSSGSVGKRGMIIATIVLALVGLSYAASLLLSDRYGSLIPGQNSPPTKIDLRAKQPLAPEPRQSIGTDTPASKPIAPPATELKRSGAIAPPADSAARAPAAVEIQNMPPPKSIPETVTDDLSELETESPAVRVASTARPPSPVQAATPFAGIALDRSQPALRPHELGMASANVAAETSRPLAALRSQAPMQQPQAPAPVPVVKNAANIITGTTNRATVTSFGAPAQAPQAPADTALTEGTQQNSELPPAGVGPLSLRMSAAQGDPSATFEVGSRLAEGKGVRQDFNGAYTWYQRSAAKGFALAQYRLGTLYERGLGTPADLSRARVWYKRAAEQGNVKAMHNLAVLAAGRDGTPPDHVEAAKWFTLAADRGLPDSQFNLGVLLENGLGVAKDQRAAYKWFSLAANKGDKDAARRRDALLASLDVNTLGALDAELQQWRPRTTDRVANEPRVAGDLWRNRRPSEPPQQQGQAQPTPPGAQPGAPQMQQQAGTQPVQASQPSPTAARRMMAPPPIR